MKLIQLTSEISHVELKSIQLEVQLLLIEFSFYFNRIWSHLRKNLEHGFIEFQGGHKIRML